MSTMARFRVFVHVLVHVNVHEIFQGDVNGRFGLYLIRNFAKSKLA